jgi:hypothetical protein
MGTLRITPLARSFSSSSGSHAVLPLLPNSAMHLAYIHTWQQPQRTHGHQCSTVWIVALKLPRHARQARAHHWVAVPRALHPLRPNTRCGRGAPQRQRPRKATPKHPWLAASSTHNAGEVTSPGSPTLGSAMGEPRALPAATRSAQPASQPQRAHIIGSPCLGLCTHCDPIHVTPTTSAHLISYHDIILCCLTTLGTRPARAGPQSALFQAHNNKAGRSTTRARTQARTAVHTTSGRGSTLTRR